MTYALPSEVESLTGLFLWANSVTEDLLAKVILLTFWVVMTTWLLTTGMDVKAITISTGMTLIVAMLFQISGFVTFPLVMIILVAFIILIIGTRMVS